MLLHTVLMTGNGSAYERSGALSASDRQWCSLATGVYTAMSRSIDKDGNLIDPVKAPWRTGGAFTTPPGWWHSHVNETDEDAWVLPIQDAGLFTHQVRPETAE